jgi:phospholipid/cholesterol/gamma-HCH transport system substrate-binding protein
MATTGLFSNTRRNVIAAAIVIALLLAAWLAPFQAGTRTVTAHFPQSIGIFEGSDVTIMGVPVGRVQKIVPEGDSVRVEMTYSSKYKLPADVKAAIITPTLVADRFVQLVPAYSGGPALNDGGDIPLDRSVVPVEMDQIYRSLNEITTSLGPNGANKNGALAKVLKSTADSLRGNGAVGHDAIANLAAAARTLGDNSPELFATVESLAQITDTLGKNDKDVSRFLKDLAKVSDNLAGESDDLQDALEAIARAVSVTQDFVHDNRKPLVADLDRLGHLLSVIASQSKSLKTTLDVAPLGISNLGLQFDTTSAGAGIRLQLGPLVSDLPNVLCTLIANSGAPSPDLVCNLFKALLPADVLAKLGGGITDSGVPEIPSIAGAAGGAGSPKASTIKPTSPVLGSPAVGVKSLTDQITALLSGAKGGAQ